LDDENAFSRSVPVLQRVAAPGNYVQRFVRRVLDRRRRLRNGSSLARGWRKSKNVRVA
jgi:hypothetical protein